MGDAPLTWGYALLTMFALFSFRKPEQKYTARRLNAYLLTLPFQVLLAITILLNGYVSFGQLAAFLITFHFLPLVFFLSASEYIENIDLEYFYKIFKACLFLVAIYGIFLFFLKAFTGKFIKIPLLTSNLHDSGDLLHDKHNQRGMLFKLISTYNNGNIYGACMLILLPFYCTIEQSKWKHWLVKFSLLLTLSRTSWMGLIFNDFILNWLIDKKTTFYSFKMALKIAMMIGALGVISHFIGLGSSLLLDPSMGGRDVMFHTAASSSFFSSLPLAAISEAVYLSVTAQFGYIGLIFFLLNLLSPLIVSLSFRVANEEKRIRTSLVCGLLNYLFICLSDGAMIFIPTMAFYWFLSSFLLRRSFSAEKNAIPG